MPHLIVGLGNPGTQYEYTRHNAGFLAIDALAKELEIRVKKKLLLPAEIGETTIADGKVVLVKPTTFMNLSGKAVGALARKYRVTPDQVVVLSDDVDLPLGTIRIRKGGGAGGHNGLKSIIEAIGTDVIRVRIGVGAPPPHMPLDAYVLQRFSNEELTKALAAVTQAASAALDVIHHGAREQTFTI